MTTVPAAEHMDHLLRAETLPRAVLLEPNDGCLTIARRLAARGVEVVALCTPPTEWVGRSRTLRAVPVESLPGGARSSWLRALTDLADRPGVLICGSDAASEFVVEHRADIPGELLSFESGSSAHLRLMDKDSLRAVAAEAGVRVPRTFRIDDADATDLLREAESSAPCVAKPVMGHVGRRAGAFATRRLADARAVREHLRAALDAGVPMLISEDVPGPTTANEGVLTLRLPDGTRPLEAGRRKIRAYDYGSGTLFESYPAGEAMALARRILEAADYVGLAATEFMRHSGTGELYLIEVNVRVPQSFGLYEAAGLEASWRLYSALAGMPLPEQPAARHGARAWIPQHDLHVIREMQQQRRVRLPEVVGPLAGVRNFGALSWRDPGPALALARAELTRFRSRRAQ